MIIVDDQMIVNNVSMMTLDIADGFIFWSVLADRRFESLRRLKIGKNRRFRHFGKDRRFCQKTPIWDKIDDCPKLLILTKTADLNLRR